MSDPQSFPVYRATVRDADGERDIITFLSADEVEQAGGIAPEAVVGVLPVGAELAPEAFRQHARFVALLHQAVAEAVPRIEEFVAGAKQQGEGWIMIHDARSFGQDPEVAGRDAIGAFPLEAGVMHAGSYSPNPHYRVLTEFGLPAPHPDIVAAVMTALRALRFDAAEGR